VSNQKTRIEKLEASTQAAPEQAAEVYGLREDGMRYRIDDLVAFVECSSELTDANGAPLGIEYNRAHRTLREALAEIVEQ
jgi:hypothetical protein